MSHHWFDDPIPAPDSTVRVAAGERQAQLTKPPGSLGQIEKLGITLAASQPTAAATPRSGLDHRLCRRSRGHRRRCIRFPAGGHCRNGA